MAIKTSGTIKSLKIGAKSFELVDELPGAAEPVRLFHVDLEGVKDSSNALFVSPVPILRDRNGHPRGILTHAANLLVFTDGVPAPGEYTVVANREVILGTPPDAADRLGWLLIETTP